MPLRLCDSEGCGKPAAQRAGDCLLCDKHFCRTHRQKPWHRCPDTKENWEAYSAQYAATEARHIDELISHINCANLCSRATHLRGGIPCTVDLSRKSLSSLMGGQNCHADIVFDDNVKWLAHFRLARTSSPPNIVSDWILRSEAATMIYLQHHTNVPTPKIFDWASSLDSENTIGVSYILMERLQGKPLEWQDASPTQKDKILQQLADISIELGKHSFARVGSLALVGGTLDVRGLAHHSTFDLEEGPLGPFACSQDASQALIKSYLDMIASGEIDTSSPVDTYLAHRFRLDVIDELWKQSSPEKGSSFFLKHPDDKGDHILVNDSFDIVGVIDWEWSQTVSKAEAFCSPCMMWPVGKFYDGSNELATDEVRLTAIFKERGRDDLAQLVLAGRKFQRFHFALGADCSYLDRETFLRLFEGLYTAFRSDYKGWDHWKSQALEKWKDDELLRSLLELE